MSRTREQLRRRRWLRRIWLAVLVMAAAALWVTAGKYAARLDAQARQRQAAVEAAMGSGEGLYTARMEGRP